MKIRIYEDTGHGPSDEPVATVRIAVPGEATTSSRPSGQPATYALESVESADPTVGDRVRTALSRTSMPVTRSLVSVRGAVRTRGEGRTEAPHGTAAFWRAALAFPFDGSLRSDPDDYARLLAAIDPLLPAVEPAPAREAEPVPAHAVDPGGWYVSLVTLLDRLGSAEFVAELVRTPSRVVTRGVATRGGETASPIDPIVERLRTNPEFLKAVAHLGLALSLPERQKVLESLESFARRAQSHDAQPE